MTVEVANNKVMAFVPYLVESLTYIKKKKTARTSSTSSNALQNVFYKNDSWLNVKSPGTKPDCRRERKLLE